MNALLVLVEHLDVFYNLFLLALNSRLLGGGLVLLSILTGLGLVGVSRSTGRFIRVFCGNIDGPNMRTSNFKRLLFLGFLLRLLLGNLLLLLGAGGKELLVRLVAGKSQNDRGDHKVQPIGKDGLDELAKDGTSHLHGSEEKGHVVVDEGTGVVLDAGVHGIAQREGAVGNVLSIGLLVLILVVIFGGQDNIAVGVALAGKVADLLVWVLGTNVDNETAQTGTENTGLGQTGGWLGSELQEEDAQGNVDAAAADTTSSGYTGRQKPNKRTNNIIPQVVIVLVGVVLVVATIPKEFAIEAKVVDGVCTQKEKEYELE